MSFHVTCRIADWMDYINKKLCVVSILGLKNGNKVKAIFYVKIIASNTEVCQNNR